MNLTDGIDVATELLLRRTKRAIAAAFVVLCLVNPAAVARASLWYATQKAENIVNPIASVTLRPVPIDGQGRP